MNETADDTILELRGVPEALHLKNYGFYLYMKSGTIHVQHSNKKHRGPNPSLLYLNLYQIFFITKF